LVTAKEPTRYQSLLPEPLVLAFPPELASAFFSVFSVFSVLVSSLAFGFDPVLE